VFQNLQANHDVEGGIFERQFLSISLLDKFGLTNTQPGLLASLAVNFHASIVSSMFSQHATEHAKPGSYFKNRLVGRYILKGKLVPLKM
jgi:hypothetical protein